ncbi:phosphatase PAP2 family protein [Roseibium aggregatum]|nr:phosphatase PAP2 family protein [Roseibium aggregatum]
MSQTRHQQHNPKTGLNKTAKWCVTHPMLCTGLYICLVSLFFLTFPGVDLWASGLFHFGDEGFKAENVAFLRDVRHLGPFLVRVIAIACVAVLLIKLLVPSRPPLMPLRQPVFLLSTLILGPGVLVNLILKDNWGRPRPRNVEIFGGDLPYQPVWKISNYCDSNCSFVSGEGSAAMWLVAALALLVPATWRKGTLAFLIPLGLILSANRVAFGGHFLSDTLLSWGVTLLLVLAVHHLLYRKTPPLVSDRQLDEWFTVWGRRLQHVLQRLALRARRTFRKVGRVFSER